MRIALRTSGGRGEYELAGRQGDINASDLFDKEILYELTPAIVIPGRAVATRTQGKPRIRLEDKQNTTHFYRLLAGVLLLPKPKREFRETHGSKLLVREAYSMTAIKVDVGAVHPDAIILRPTDLLLENADDRQRRLIFAQRMARVSRLWDAASTSTVPLAELIRSHMDAVTSKNPNHKDIEKKAEAISAMLRTDGDPLHMAEEKLGVEKITEISEESDLPKGQTHQAEFGQDDDIDPSGARIERVKQWRQLAVRGTGGKKFRNDIMGAYNNRCLFSGQRLPRMDTTSSSGVDAAHILPWSTHDINSVRNGIALNKICHWAFDEGILRLSFDKSSNKYLLEVPPAIQKSAKKFIFDIDHFVSLTGPIPESRLPESKELWPSPIYIEELNSFMSTPHEN